MRWLSSPLAAAFLKTAIKTGLEVFALGRIEPVEIKSEVDERNSDSAEASLLLGALGDRDCLLLTQCEMIVIPFAGQCCAGE